MMNIYARTVMRNLLVFLPRLGTCKFSDLTVSRDTDIANLSVCLSVCICLSVRLSVRNVPVSDENGLTYRHRFFHHTVAESFQFYQHQTPSRNSDGVTPCGALNTRGCKKIRDFLPISRYNSQTIQDIAIVTMEGEQKLVCDLSNGAISNDLERTLTVFLRPHQSVNGAA